MPYVKIEVTREGVTREQKQALVRGVTALLERVLAKDPATTFVTIDEIDTDNWGIGGELVSDRRARQAEARAQALPEATAPISADLAAASEDVSALLAAVRTYLDGLYFADAARLGRVLHPEARYLSAASGRLEQLDVPTYLERVRGRVAPARSGAPRHDRILALDLAGPRTALVKLECAVPPRHFTDYLSFIKDEGGWRIIAKVFEARELPT